MKCQYYHQMLDKVQKDDTVFIAPTATVLGNVTLKSYVSVWYGAVIRGDFDKIMINERTNIQEGVILHVDHYTPISIGKDVVVGHGAIIHGANIGDACLIGMRSTIMNHAVIGRGCIIGAHTLITEGMKIPDYSMVLGTPGKVVKTLPPTIVERIQFAAKIYVEESQKYLKNTDSQNNMT